MSTHSSVIYCTQYAAPVAVPGGKRTTPGVGSPAGGGLYRNAWTPRVRMQLGKRDVHRTENAIS